MGRWFNLKKLRDVFGRVLVRFSQLALGLAILLGIYVVVTSYRYDVSLQLAAKGVFKELSLTGIRAAVFIYDPCKPRLASTGPNVNELQDRADYVRIDQLLTPGSTVRTPSGRRLAVQDIHNEVISRSPYVFRYQPYDEPRLHELRRKYRLDDVVAPATDEFEAMVLLRNWTRRQFRRSDYQLKMANFDALEILDRGWRNHGEPYTPDRHFDPCHFFPMLYCQVMLSMGHHARMMSVGHGHAEVWSNQHRKWIVMDAELNHHYTKDGVPLNMVELFEENYSQTPNRVRIVQGPQSPGSENTTMAYLGFERLTIEEALPWFNHPIDMVDLRNDWMTNHYFRGHPARNETNSLIFLDPRLKRPSDFERRLRPVTAEKTEFYWTLNQTEIWVKRRVGDELELAFSTVTPNFGHFEAVVDGQAPIRLDAATFQWKLHEGANSFSVRAINRFGVKGIESAVKLSAVEGGR